MSHLASSSPTVFKQLRLSSTHNPKLDWQPTERPFVTVSFYLKNTVSSLILGKPYGLVMSRR